MHFLEIFGSICPDFRHFWVDFGHFWTVFEHFLTVFISRFWVNGSGAQQAYNYLQVSSLDKLETFEFHDFFENTDTPPTRTFWTDIFKCIFAMKGPNKVPLYLFFGQSLKHQDLPPWFPKVLWGFSSILFLVTHPVGPLAQTFIIVFHMFENLVFNNIGQLSSTYLCQS